jgi:hypothetical protein
MTWYHIYLFLEPLGNAPRREAYSRVNEVQNR